MGRIRGLLVAVAVAGVLAGSGCTVNPVTGEPQLDLMGRAQEIDLGKRLYPRYTQQSLGEVPDEKLEAYVDRVGLRLARVSQRPALPWTYNAVNDPEVNAYALPGGKISITRGLLARLDSEDQLAAVLGHETGHVTARHAAQAYTRQMLAQIALLGSAAYMEAKGTRNARLYTLGGVFGAELLFAHYSRNQERQADHLGLDYMTRAGYNPRAIVGVMNVLVHQEKRQPSLLGRMFADHPMSSERLATARAEVAALSPQIRHRPFRTKAFRVATRHVRATRDAYDRLARARRLLAKKNTAKALPLLRQSVNEWPSEGLLRAYLAAGEAESNRLQQAMRNAHRAANDAPHIFFVQFVAARIFLRGKRYDEALSYLDGASRILPDTPEVELLRGEALQGAGRQREAVGAYERTRQLAPGSEAAKEAARRLEAMGLI